MRSGSEEGISYPIHYAVSSEFQCPEFTPCLGWTHYRLLMRVKRPEARAFYEIEASNNNWSARELERQIGAPVRQIGIFRK